MSDERIERCPRCGANASDHVALANPGIVTPCKWACGTYRVLATGEIVESEDCLRRQLAQAEERAKADADYRMRMDVPMEMIADELDEFDESWTDDKIVDQARQELQDARKRADRAEAREANLRRVVERMVEAARKVVAVCECWDGAVYQPDVPGAGQLISCSVCGDLRDALDALAPLSHSEARRGGGAG